MGSQASVLVPPGLGRSRRGEDAPIGPIVIAPILVVAATIGWAVVHGSEGLAVAALRFALVYGVGIGGLVRALEEIDSRRAPRPSARDRDSGAVTDRALTYLAVGTLGVACAWRGEGFWEATIAAVAILGFGTAAARVAGMIAARRVGPLAEAVTAGWDVILASALIALAWAA
jgi:Family of unknown function (DUF6790)